MSIRVVIVDDSSFFRRVLRGVLAVDPAIELVGEARDGAEAVEMVARLKPDVVTMDVEMPVMGGIAAVSEIMKKSPTKVLMMSSLTQKGASFTMDALAAGAVDFMTKDIRGASHVSDQFTESLLTKLKQVHYLGRHQRQSDLVQNVHEEFALASGSDPVAHVSSPRLKQHRMTDKRLLLLGASTGGPAALQYLVPLIPVGFPVPVVIVQHMPEAFTLAFAQRLDEHAHIPVVHASDGLTIEPGCAYVAPGGKQIFVDKKDKRLQIAVRDPEPSQIYRPSLDIAFSSAARSMGSSTCAMVLTGMGADGREGARNLKRAGGTVWAQDQASSVIYGMPMAVSKAGLADEVFSLKQFGALLQEGDA